MNTYTGLHARHYDAVYRDKPYAAEARFVDAILRDAGVDRRALLDVACGTGRHVSEFAKLGWDVTGVDVASPLLELAHTNAPAARFLQQDMRALDLPGERFDAITCLFDSIGYALDDAGVVSTLVGFKRHLAPSGALVIEFLHAPALLNDASPVRVRRIGLSADGHELLRISRTRLNEQRSLMEVEFELLELRVDGTYERWLETQTNRFFFVSEMQAFVERADLQVERLVPAYREGLIDDDTFHVIAVARRTQ